MWVIACEKVLVLIQCSSSHCSLSMHRISFDSHLDFQRYAIDKLITAKISKGITCDRATILAFTLSKSPLSMFQVSSDSL